MPSDNAIAFEMIVGGGSKKSDLRKNGDAASCRAAVYEVRHSALGRSGRPNGYSAINQEKRSSA
jgi:hypothetical protein